MVVHYLGHRSNGPYRDFEMVGVRLFEPGGEGNLNMNSSRLINLATSVRWEGSSTFNMVKLDSSLMSSESPRLVQGSFQLVSRALAHMITCACLSQPFEQCDHF